MSDTRIQFQEGYSFALDDFIATGTIHIEDLGDRLFIGVNTADELYHFEVVVTRNEYIRCVLIDKEEHK
jgi:hypothetical protein